MRSWNDSHQPIAIVAPFGQRTALETDNVGLLKSVTPAGNTNAGAYDLSYFPGTALLRSFSNPLHHASNFTYDDKGQLLLDADAAGSTRMSDGTQHVTLADGRKYTTTVTGDPRWGMIKPVASTTIETGAGISVRNELRQVTLSDLSDPLSVASSIDG